MISTTPLAVAFVFAITLLKPTIAGVEALLGLYLAIALGLAVSAFLRLAAWKRTHPWSPPPERALRGMGRSTRTPA